MFIDDADMMMSSKLCRRFVACPLLQRRIMLRANKKQNKKNHLKNSKLESLEAYQLTAAVVVDSGVSRCRCFVAAIINVAIAVIYIIIGVVVVDVGALRHFGRCVVVFATTTRRHALREEEEENVSQTQKHNKMN